MAFQQKVYCIGVQIGQTLKRSPCLLLVAVAPYGTPTTNSSSHFQLKRQSR